MAKEENISVDLLDEEQWGYVQRKYNIPPREFEVAKEVCRGLTNDKVSKKLNMASGTVKTHLRNIYRRVRVNSKILLLLKFVEDSKDLKK